MAILFCGIVMSQYAHYNLSPVTQITMQQTMRTLAFACESCIFAYLVRTHHMFSRILSFLFVIVIFEKNLSFRFRNNSYTLLQMFRQFCLFMM